ncbi:MAG TPA: response regulator transcription factor [Acidimicrobiales bacterium]|nr:response regulator transcription factor [Acidimicrobiales bacterium]
MRVLVVEDEELLADAIARGLRREAIAVDVSLDGDDALGKLAVTDYDVVVLDRDLPGTHGDDVCRQLVSSGAGSRILMLTAASEVGERVTGLSIGADDYMGKPFSFAELVARIRALARRPSVAHQPVLVRGDVSLDPARRLVTRAGVDVPLGRREFAVLEVLLRAEGAVVSAEELLEKVWDEHADPFSNAVRVTVARVRRKLGEPPLIETVVGGGYRL